MKVGFVGFGTIAQAIAVGLGTTNSPDVSVEHFHVSQRSPSKSAALLSQFGAEKVTVAGENNQPILDTSDIIFLCVLPQQMEVSGSNSQSDKLRRRVWSFMSSSNTSE